MSRLRLAGACTLIGSLGAAAFGGWDQGLKLLVCLMGADYITGLLVALVFHNSPKTGSGCGSSRAGFAGLCRKATIMLVVLIAYRLELTTGISYIRAATIYSFCTNELVSLVENVGLMGLPLPKVIKRAIDVLKEVGDNGD